MSSDSFAIAVGIGIVIATCLCQGISQQLLQPAMAARNEEAVVKAGAVRFRPIVLTALALVAGGAVILLDPIFQGLAVALISGVVVATALTLVVIPLLYFMYIKAAGMPPTEEEA